MPLQDAVGNVSPNGKRITDFHDSKVAIVGRKLGPSAVCELKKVLVKTFCKLSRHFGQLHSAGTNFPTDLPLLLPYVKKQKISYFFLSDNSVLARKPYK